MKLDLVALVGVLLLVSLVTYGLLSLVGVL